MIIITYAYIKNHIHIKILTIFLSVIKITTF